MVDTETGGMVGGISSVIGSDSVEGCNKAVIWCMASLVLSPTCKCDIELGGVFKMLRISSSNCMGVQNETTC